MVLDIGAALDRAGVDVTSAGSGPPPATGTPASGTSTQTGSPAASEPGLNIGGPSAAGAVDTAASATSAGQGGGAGSAGTQAQAAWSLRDELRAAGVDPSGFADDRSAWQAMQRQMAAQQARYEQSNQVASWYLANQQRIQAALSAQQPAPAAPKPEESWWQAPEWKPEWERFLEVDPQTGIPRIAPHAMGGVDPALPYKYLQHREWQKERLAKLLANPIETLKPGLEQLIEAKAKELMQKELGAYREQTTAQQYVQGQPWMVQRDQANNVVTDPYGRPMISAAGRRFGEYVQWLEQRGVRDVETQRVLAEQLVQAESLRGMYATAAQNGGTFPGFGAHAAINNPNQPAAGGNQQLKANALNGNGARHIAGAGGATPNAGYVPAGNPPAGRNRGLPLRERLAKAFQENGVTNVF